MDRPPRLAVAVLPGLDHFVGDLVRALNASGALETRVFRFGGGGAVSAGLAEMMQWADCRDSDTLWFEFCWPPFPAMIAATDFGGRRVVVRIHRIEAYGTGHVAGTDWSRVTDVIVVGTDMAARVRAAAPEIGVLTRLHVVHNGIDHACFTSSPVGAPPVDPHRIGWCGWFSLHKNPLLALEILHRLHQHDARYRLHISTKGGEPVAIDAFHHLAHRLSLTNAIHFDGAVAPGAAMAAWHRRNTILLSTSVYESFGFAIAEAAACGCDLAILDNTAAAEFWPAETLFAHADQAAERIRQAAPNRWRALVFERFDIGRQVLAIITCLDAPMADRRVGCGASR